MMWLTLYLFSLLVNGSGNKPLEFIPGGTVSWRTLESGLLEVTLTTSLTGTDKWYAFGPSAAGNMIDGDAFVAMADSQTLVRMRTVENGILPLPVENQSEHTLVSFTIADSSTTVVWTMNKEHYCDPMLDIFDKDRWYAYAWGSLPFDYPGHLVNGGRGSITANLGSTADRSVPDLSLSFEKWTITMSDHEVNTESNSYYCQYFPVPGTEGYRRGVAENEEDYGEVGYIMGHKPVITSRMVHHIVVYWCRNDMSYNFDADSNRNEGAPFECSNMPRGCDELIPHAWAPGSMEYWKYPDFKGQSVGYEMGGGRFSHLVVQMHYNNPNGDAGVRDNSGFDLYYSRDPVGYIPKLQFMGPSLGQLQIPPCQDWFEVDTYFPPQCQAFTSSKWILGSFPHMHQIGKTGSLTLIRDGEEVVELANSTYHFDFQTMYVFGEPVEMKPMDALRLSCVYDSHTADYWTKGGDYSEQEMCFFGLLFITDPEIERYWCRQATHSSFRYDEEQPLSWDLAEKWRENDIELYQRPKFDAENWWESETFVNVPFGTSTDIVPEGIKRYESDMSWKNYKRKERKGQTCPWSKDFDSKAVGDNVEWPDYWEYCKTDDNAQVRTYFAERYPDEDWLGAVVTGGCSIVSTMEDELEKWNFCNNEHDSIVGQSCPCRCAEARDPSVCEDDDEKVAEGARSQGVQDVPDCAAAKQKGYCTMEEVQGVCPVTCETCPAVGCGICENVDEVRDKVATGYCWDSEREDVADMDQRTCVNATLQWMDWTCGMQYDMLEKGATGCSMETHEWLSGVCACDRRNLDMGELLRKPIQPRRRLQYVRPPSVMTCSDRTETSARPTETSARPTETSARPTEVEVKTEFKMNGVTTENFEGLKPGIKKVLSAETSVPQDKITLVLKQSSRLRRRLNQATIEATFQVANEGAATSLSNTLYSDTFVSDLNEAIDAEDSLADITIAEVNAPVVEASTDDDDSNSTLTIVLIVVGAVVFIAIAVLAYFMFTGSKLKGEAKTDFQQGEAEGETAK